MQRSDERAEVGTLVLRPSVAQHKLWLSTMSGAGVLVAGMIVVGRPGSDLGQLAVIALVASPLLACLAGALVVYLRRARVVITPAHIGTARFSRRPRLHPREDIASAVIAKLTPAGETEARAFENLFLFGVDGRRLLRLTSRYWTSDDMQCVVSALGITPVVLAGALTGRDLADCYPKALRWPERHLVPFVLLIIISTIGISAALAALCRAVLLT